jgi:hypothetical protein
MGPLLEFYLEKKDGNDFAVNIDGQLTEFVNNEVSHDEVDKGVSAAIVLNHGPSQGSNSQEEVSNWTRTTPGAGMTAK